jgi:hypothetical protein
MARVPTSARDGMTREQLLWIVIALVQLAMVVVAAVYVRRHPSRQYWISGSTLVGVGLLIVVVSVAWLLTGGEGQSPILMRGGWFGFWLGLATAAEMILLGILLFANRQGH